MRRLFAVPPAVVAQPSDEQLLAELRQFASSSKSGALAFRRESILALLKALDARDARIKQLQIDALEMRRGGP